MPNGSGARRGRTIWWAGFLSLALYLGAGGVGLGAESRQPASTTTLPDVAASPDTEVDLAPAPRGDIVRPGDPLNQALAGVGARLDELARLVKLAEAERDALLVSKEQNQQLLARIAVLEAERARLPDVLQLAKELSAASDAAHARVQGLVEELIAERKNNEGLGADLAAAKAERAQIEQLARANGAALAAWIGGLQDELAEREVQLADAGAALKAQSETRRVAEARVAQAERARAAEQLAAMQDQLRVRDREIASARTESEDLRQRLDATQAVLRRKGAENAWLAAELAAAHRAADFARVMVEESVAAMEDQIGMLHAAAGDAPPGPSDQPVELPPATLAGVVPAMPHPKPRLEAGELDAWAPAWHTADGKAAAAAAVMEDGVWLQAGLRDAAGSAREPTTEPVPFVTPEGPKTGDVISTAALLADPVGPARVPGSNAADQSTPLLEWGDRAGLTAAATRLADGLRASREEAMFQRQERVFTVDVEERAFTANPAVAPVPLDPALDIRLFTARSELVGDNQGGIRFYPDGSSTGGRIELELLGDRAAVNVRWSTGAVTLER